MDLALKQYLTMLKVKKIKGIKVSIYGGEPLLNKKNLFGLIEKYGGRYRGINLEWIVNTNGSLLTEQDILFFKKYNVDIHLSCDGFERTHNQNRIDKLGHGTFQKTKKALVLIKKRKVSSQINSFVMPENIEHLKEIVEIAKKFGIKRIYLDLFYAPKMMNASKVTEKYFEVYEYAKSQGVELFGPWNEVCENYLSGQHFKYPAMPSVDVNVDGSWSFARIPQNNLIRTFKLDDFRNKFILNQYTHLISRAKRYLDKECQKCSLKEFCFGKAIFQYQYHTKKVRGWQEVCRFMRQMGLRLAAKNKNTLQTVQIAITYDCNKSCYYCYAKALKSSYQQMSLADFKKALSWLESQNIKNLNFTGGEPTVHSEFAQIIELARRRGFQLGLFTNGLFSAKIFGAVGKCNNFLINYNPRAHYTAQEFKLLNRNLLKLTRAEKTIDIMFNVTGQVNSAKHIIAACRKYSIHEVLLDFIIPNAFKSNDFIDTSLFRRKKKLLLSLVRELKKQNIKVKISRPMPRCIFTQRESKWLGRFKSLRSKCGIGNTILAINPDLSIWPCLSVFLKGPHLLSLPDIKSYKAYYRKAIDILAWKRPLFKKCLKCIYFKRRECQGACLGHKCRQFYVIKNDRYIIYSQFAPPRLSRFIKAFQDAGAVLDKVFGSMDRVIRIYLFKDRQDFKIYSGQFNWPKWISAFTFPADFEYYQHSESAAGLLIKGFLHEIAHFYIQYFSRSRLPNWLAEGFCELMNFYGQDNKEKLLDLMKKKKLIPFENLYSWNKLSLLAYDPAPLPQNIAYQQSHNFVRYLAQRFGSQKLMGLITGKYNDFYEYFRELTGFDFFKVEKEWLADLVEERRIDTP